MSRASSLLVLGARLSPTLLVASSCVTTVAPTEVVVEVTSSESVQEKMDKLHLEIWSAGVEPSCSQAQCWSKRLDQNYPSQSQSWPVRFPVLPVDGDSRRVFEVIAQALDAAGNVLLEQRAVTGFVPGGSALLTLELSELCIDLAGECMPNGDCHGPLCSTCREGQCEPTGLLRASPAGMLEPVELDAGLGEDEAGGEPDLSEEAGAADDAAQDGGSDEGDAAGEGGVRTPGGPPQLDAPCSGEGALVCLGAAQKERLRCSAGRWSASPSCEASENCDRSSGNCAPIPVPCQGRTAGVSFCGENEVLTTCGADLISADTSTCPGRCTTLPNSARCAPVSCQDGRTQSPEECDDGNTSDSDSCTSACTKAVCGDGAPWDGHEECDDGNAEDSDACVRCKNASCGDMKVWTGHEQCDDGNDDDGDACVQCANARCGDGKQRAGVEPCDDGNQSDADGCTTSCKLTNGGSCSANSDCASSTCVAGKCVSKPALNGACDDHEDCSATSAPGCTNGICQCDKTVCGTACVDLSLNANHCGDCNHSCLGGGCVTGHCRPVTLATGQSSPTRIASNGTHVFWTNNGNAGAVMKVAVDGSGLTTLVPSLVRAYGIAVDSNNVYYAYDSGPPDAGVLRKLSLTGGVPVTMTTGVFDPRDVAVDADNVYIAGWELGVRQVPIGGGASVEIASGWGAWSVAVSKTTGQVYWSNVDGMSVRRAPIGGGTSQTLHTATDPSMFGGRRSIAVRDTTLYFATKDSVWSVSVFGGTPTPIATGQAAPHGLAADASGVYWTNESSSGTVSRWSPAGVEVLATGQDKPTGIALDMKAVYWVNSSGGQVMRIAK